MIPCFNEGVAIGATVRDFRATLPQAEVYVYDNNSTDLTSEEARHAGAVVRSESLQGKGNVVRRMFADVEAEVYVLVDGDATYDPRSAPSMIDKLVQNQLDMVVGCRQDLSDGAYRKGHRFGNLVLTRLLAWMFGKHFSDTLSGYRVFSRRFVKSFPALSNGFEIETEINVHALSLRMPIGEVITPYSERPEGSASKLSTYADGIRILNAIVTLVRQERPMPFFLTVSGCTALISLALFYPVAITFAHTGQVPRLPTAVLCTGLFGLSMLSATCGLILDTVTHGRRELRRLAYLTHSAPKS